LKEKERLIDQREMTKTRKKVVEEVDKREFIDTEKDKTKNYDCFFFFLKNRLFFYLCIYFCFF
jgi:hypothetical protein